MNVGKLVDVFFTVVALTIDKSKMKMKYEKVRLSKMFVETFSMIQNERKKTRKKTRYVKF